MKKCSKCKKEFSDDLNYCQTCGTNLVEVEEKKSRRKGEKIATIVVLVFFVIFVISGIANLINPAPKDESPKNIVMFRNLEYTFNQYTVLNSDLQEDKKFAVVDMTVRNKNEEGMHTVWIDDFNIYFDDIKPLDRYNGYFARNEELSPKQELNTKLLFLLKKDITTEKKSIELGKGFLTSGVTVKFSDIPYVQSSESFEKTELKKCELDDNQIAKVYKAFNEFGFINLHNLVNVSDEDSKSIGFSASNSTYMMTFLNNGDFEMYDITSNLNFLVYKNDTKNQYYITPSLIANKCYAAKTSFKTFLEIKYPSAKTSNFIYYRSKIAENVICITCILEGYNSFGMPLIEEATGYYDYNRESGKFELIGTKIGDKAQDYRVKIIFETGNSSINIPSQYVSKNYYVKQPEAFESNGSKIVGWKNKETNEVFNFDYVPSANTTLVAIWE